MTANPAIDFETIFQFAPVGMCISVDRVIQSSNDTLEAMFGYGRGELAGKSFQVLYPTMDEFLRTGDRIVPIMNAKGRYSDERIMRRANGELFWCHVSGRALDPKQPLGAGVWTFEDVSEKRPVSGRVDHIQVRLLTCWGQIRSAARCPAVEEYWPDTQVA